MSDSKLKVRAALSWKHWYWYFALAANFLPCFCATFVSIMDSKLQYPLSIIFSVLSTTSILACLLTYLYYTTREARLFHTLIKPERTKHLQLGALFSFVSITCYIVVAILAEFEQGKKYIWYISLAFNMLLGLISTIYLTLYEFCVSFDVYYHKHKHEIVHDFLKHHKKPLNLSQETLDELSDRDPSPEEEANETESPQDVEKQD